MMENELRKTKEIRDLLKFADSETQKKLSSSFDEYNSIMSKLDANKEFSLNEITILSKC
jgi:hypothetical protein